MVLATEFGVKMNVVSIAERNNEQKQANLLEVLDEMRDKVINGSMTGFVACSMSEEEGLMIHASGCDYVTAIGLFEIGKGMLNRYTEDMEEE